MKTLFLTLSLTLLTILTAQCFAQAPVEIGKSYYFYHDRNVCDHTYDYQWVIRPPDSNMAKDSVHKAATELYITRYSEVSYTLGEEIYVGYGTVSDTIWTDPPEWHVFYADHNGCYVIVLSNFVYITYPGKCEYSFENLVKTCIRCKWTYDSYRKYYPDLKPLDSPFK